MASSTPPTSSTSATAAGPKAPSYKIIEIPLLTSAGEMTITGVNNRGIAVGNYDGFCAPNCGSGAPPGRRAWMYQQSSGALNELTADPAERGAAAYGIDDTGKIAGGAFLANGPEPVLWTVTGGATILSGGVYSSYDWAVAVNAGGTVLGQFQDSGAPGSAALLFTDPGYAETVLPDLECDHCSRAYITASAINNGGTAVGSTLSVVYQNGTLVTGGTFAVEWRGGTVTSLGALQGSDSSAAYGINNSGDIVGTSGVGQAAGAPRHAFLYSHGVMTDLGTLQGDLDSQANAINDRGQIVGWSVNAAQTAHAFLYENGRMYDLRALIDPNDPDAAVISLQDAVSISSNGWIAVDGTDSRDSASGDTHAFLLIPAH